MNILIYSWTSINIVSRSIIRLIASCLSIHSIIWKCKLWSSLQSCQTWKLNFSSSFKYVIIEFNCQVWHIRTHDTYLLVDTPVYSNEMMFILLFYCRKYFSWNRWISLNCYSINWIVSYLTPFFLNILLAINYNTKRTFVCCAPVIFCC